MLKGKVALVTGSAKRTGKAIALALGREGAHVIVHFRNSENEAAEVVQNIADQGGTAQAIGGDLAKISEVKNIFQRIIASNGRIDILVNNVGNYLVKNIDQTTPEEWDFLLSTTVTSTFHTCHVALPYMVKQSFGRIINMADSAADMISPWPEITPYMVGKTGVLVLTKSLAVTYAKHNITVNAVSPGILDNSCLLYTSPSPRDPE